MFRRRSGGDPELPEWERRFAAARDLIESERPPDWLSARLADLHRALSQAASDRDRLRASLARLDLDRAGRELKGALRSSRPGPDHDRLVDSLRQRYDSIHVLHNRAETLDLAIERALADLDVLSARAIGLSGRSEAWLLDEWTQGLADDMTALEMAHAEIADL
ncbi:MAG: hypothetical protein ACO23O_01280 [Ilumatobacteraceae bacterium]